MLLFPFLSSVIIELCSMHACVKVADGRRECQENCLKTLFMDCYYCSFTPVQLVAHFFLFNTLLREGFNCCFLLVVGFLFLVYVSYFIVRMGNSHLVLPKHFSSSIVQNISLSECMDDSFWYQDVMLLKLNTYITCNSLQV